MLVFIDTEFTNFHNPKLISIGLASETGETFYAEIPYPGAEGSVALARAGGLVG